MATTLSRVTLAVVGLVAIVGVVALVRAASEPAPDDPLPDRASGPTTSASEGTIRASEDEPKVWSVDLGSPDISLSSVTSEPDQDGVSTTGSTPVTSSALFPDPSAPPAGSSPSDPEGDNAPILASTPNSPTTSTSDPSPTSGPSPSAPSSSSPSTERPAVTSQPTSPPSSPATKAPPPPSTTRSSTPTTVATSSGPGPSSGDSCLDGAGRIIAVTGSRDEQYRNAEFADGTVFDARSAVWNGRDASGTAIPWVITLRQSTGIGSGSCWVGGKVTGPWDDTSGISWADPFHVAGGFTIDVPDLRVEGVRIDNHGDGIHIVGNGGNATLSGVHLSDIHDDCVENDSLHTLTVTDSLFDGCYVAFSARPATGDGTPNRSSNLWRIDRSLVRLEPQPTVFRGPSPGHGSIFKWDHDGRAPRLAVHDSIFRVDQAPNHGTVGIPDDVDLASCSNNVVVWLGSGPYPGELPSCFRLTTDRMVWDDAVADWRRRH